MPNFVYDGVDPISEEKIDLTPLPPGADPKNYVRAADWNNAADAINDLRDSVKAGQYHGLSVQTETPPAPPANEVRLFLRTSPDDAGLLQLCVLWPNGAVTIFMESSAT